MHPHQHQEVAQMHAHCTTPENHPHPALRPHHTPPGHDAPRRTVTEGSSVDAAPVGTTQSAPPARGAVAGPAPERCPTCGRPWDLFDHDTSALLDWIERLHQDVHHLKRAVEEVLV
jgi:hypothetical protein